MAKKSTNKVTSAKVAKQASAALLDGRSSSRTRSFARSAYTENLTDPAVEEQRGTSIFGHVDPWPRGV